MWFLCGAALLMKVRTTADCYRFHGIWHFPCAGLMYTWWKLDAQSLVPRMFWFSLTLAAFATNYRSMSRSPHWQTGGTAYASGSLYRAAGLSLLAAAFLAAHIVSVSPIAGPASLSGDFLLQVMHTGGRLVLGLPPEV